MNAKNRTSSPPKLETYLSRSVVRKLVEGALEEDIGRGDITTLGSMGERYGELVSLKLVAKSDGVLAGIELFSLAMEIAAEEVGPVDFEFKVTDGQKFGQSDILAFITAPKGPALTGERTALNFLGRLSGIATLSAQFVAKVQHTSCKILDTRKTTPGWRALEKYAVACGGARNHRRGLDDMALIKENHICAAGSITDAVKRIRKYMQNTQRLVPLEIEVKTVSELREALECEVENILLDNQSIPSLTEMVQCARERNPNVKLEASGNVTLANVGQIAATGVDFISVGALTHSAPVADLSLLFE